MNILLVSLSDIKLDGGAMVNAKDWQVIDKSFEYHQVPFLHVVWILGVYLQSSPPVTRDIKEIPTEIVHSREQTDSPVVSDEANSMDIVSDQDVKKETMEVPKREIPCYVVFPWVVVDQFINQIDVNNHEHEIVPIYSRLKQDLGPMFANPQVAMEALCKLCVAVRFREDFNQKRTFGYYFPFLEESFVKNEVLSNTRGYYLPKMVAEPMKESIDKKKPKIMKVLKTEYPNHGVEFVCVHQNDWDTLVTWVEKEILYIAAPQSSSADLYVFWPKSILAFQLKSGATPLSVGTVADECEKTFILSLLKMGYTITLVIAAASLNDQVKNLHLSRQNSISCTKYAIKMEAGTKLQYQQYDQTQKRKRTEILVEYIVPKNTQVIILLKHGLEMFISSYNLSVIQ